MLRRHVYGTCYRQRHYYLVLLPEAGQSKARIMSNSYLTAPSSLADQKTNRFPGSTCRLARDVFPHTDIRAMKRWLHRESATGMTVQESVGSGSPKGRDVSLARYSEYYYYLSNQLPFGHQLSANSFHSAISFHQSAFISDQLSFSN